MGWDWRSDIVLLLMVFFTLGVLQSLRTCRRARRTLREQIDGPRPTWGAIRALTVKLDRPL